MTTLREDAAELDLRGLRARLHAYPEVGLVLPRTQETVLEALNPVGLDHLRCGSALSSVVGVVRGGLPGPTVLLRADLDALPFAGGPRHACGHDQHATMLVGAAHLLGARREALAGDVVLMFQPGEEGHDGAAMMIAEGLLATTGGEPVAAYALHSAADSPSGHFSNVAGPALAASATITVTVHGRGGHGAWPHRAANPIPALATVLTTLESTLTQEFDAHEPVVLSVGRIHAGTQPAIVPAEAELHATARAVSDDSLARLIDSVGRVAHGVAAARGLDATTEIRPGYPVTVNDPGEADAVARTVTDMFGPERFTRDVRPAMVSDDIGRVLARVPGAMTSVGACPPGRDLARVPGNHAPDAHFDDAVLPDGAALLAALALRRLAPQTIES